MSRWDRAVCSVMVIANSRPNASQGANYMPSRTPTAPDVTGRPKKIIKDNNLRSHCLFTPYNPEGKVSRGASKLTKRLKNSFCLQTLRLLNCVHQDIRCCCPIHTDLKSLPALILISYVYTVFYSTVCLCRSDIARSYIDLFLIPFLYFGCVCIACIVVKLLNNYSLDIAALLELETQAFRYTHNNIC